MRNMFAFAGVALTAGLVALYSPQFIENAPGACGALTSKVMGFSADQQLRSNPFAKTFANGLAAPFVEGWVEVTYPNLPPGVTCAYMYWNLQFNPDAQVAARKLMAGKG